MFVALREGSAAKNGTTYLATFRFRVSADARGVFAAVLNVAAGTILADEATQTYDLTVDPPATITIR